MKMFLTDDVSSNVKVNVVYGRKGELVTIVSMDYGNMAIVEGEGGRFAVRKELLSVEPIKSNSEVTPPVVVTTNISRTKRPTTGKKVVASKQQSIF